MDLNLPFGSAARQYRWNDLRELMLYLAIKTGLPIDAVKKIRNEFLSRVYERQTLFRIQRRLMHNPYGTSFLVGHRPWSGTQRMMNRRRLISKYVSDNERTGWVQEVADLGFITYDAPRTERNQTGFRVQGQGIMNVLPRYRSPF